MLSAASSQITTYGIFIVHATSSAVERVSKCVVFIDLAWDLADVSSLEKYVRIHIRISYVYISSFWRRAFVVPLCRVREWNVWSSWLSRCVLIRSNFISLPNLPLYLQKLLIFEEISILVQWNLFRKDTNRTKEIVLNKKVSSFQGEKCTPFQSAWVKCVVFIKLSRRVLIREVYIFISLTRVSTVSVSAKITHLRGNIHTSTVEPVSIYLCNACYIYVLRTCKYHKKLPIIICFYVCLRVFYELWS